MELVRADLNTNKKYWKTLKQVLESITVVDYAYPHQQYSNFGYVCFFASLLMTTQMSAKPVGLSLSHVMPTDASWEEPQAKINCRFRRVIEQMIESGCDFETVFAAIAEKRKQAVNEI